MSPQTTTEPSVFNAAKAVAVEEISTTPPVNLSATETPLPPLSLLLSKLGSAPNAPLPQTTTEPLVLSAANAPPVEKTSRTPLLR